MEWWLQNALVKGFVESSAKVFLFLHPLLLQDSLQAGFEAHAVLCLDFRSYASITGDTKDAAHLDTFERD